MKRIHPNWFLAIGIIFLIVPATVYLCFLIPQMKEEYIVLMSSGGAIGSAGLFGAEMIPETAKFGTLYKTASKAMTMLVIITLVQDFVKELIGLAIVLVISYIIFVVFKELWKDGKQARENKHLAAEVARSLTEAVK